MRAIWADTPSRRVSGRSGGGCASYALLVLTCWLSTWGCAGGSAGGEDGRGGSAGAEDGGGGSAGGGSAGGTAGAGGGSAGGGGAVSLGDLAADLAGVLCDRDVRCGVYPDKATCLANTAAVIDESELMAHVNTGTTVYDGNLAASCLAALESATSLGSCSVTDQRSVPLPPACRATTRGTFAPGAACSDGYVCQSNTCGNITCTGATGCCMGTCSTPSVPLGGACTFGDGCPDGDFCQLSLTGGTCVPRLAAGQACTADDNCVAGTLCLSSVCARLPAEGAPCDVTLGCDARADYCGATCTRRIAPGGRCFVGNECAVYSTCDLTTGTCVTRAAARATCSASGECLASLTCANNVCTAPAPPPLCP